MKIDFHVHTRFSVDSIIRPRDLARKSLGLGIIPAVCDHNSIDAHEKLRALRAPFIPAEEIFTDKGDLIGLYVDELIPKGTQFSEALDRIHEQGGLAYLPHMFDITRKGGGAHRDAARVDIVEVFNARCLRAEYNGKAAQFAKAHGLPAAAGSDSHFLFEFGTTYTILPDCDMDDPKALLRALKKAKLVTRPAPVYVRGTTKLISIGRKVSRRLGFRV